MPRPKKPESRTEKLNLRFSPREFAKIFRHATLTGKTLPDFGRASMLRRPRPTRQSAPDILSLPPRIITSWHKAGLQLNAIAHHVNNTEAPYLPTDLPQTIRAMRSLLRRSFPQLASEERAPAYRLHPAVRYHVRRCCTNLVQIADRHRALDAAPPVPLSNLIGRFRLILDGDA